MSNIVDYMTWRQDITLKERPFNEVDNLVLSALSYYNFKDIIPSEGITIADAWQKYKQLERKIEGLILSIDNTLLSKMAESARFGSAILLDYQDVINDKTQFAALHIILSDGSHYLAFRGTDDTLIGWKEDFILTYEITPAQKMACEYLEKVIKKDQYYRVGGHSKGGNLAVYGTLNCPKEIQNRITDIYCNDGPGLCFDIISKEDYQNIQSKIHKFVPAFDVVGMLFDREENVTIIQSVQKGILQHSLFSWEVAPTKIVRADHFEHESVVCQNIFQEWLDDMEMEDRQKLVNELFDALFEKGYQTLSEAAEMGVDGFITLIRTISDNSRDILRKLAKTGLSDLRKDLILKKESS